MAFNEPARELLISIRAMSHPPLFDKANSTNVLASLKNGNFLRDQHASNKSRLRCNEWEQSCSAYPQSIRLRGDASIRQRSKRLLIALPDNTSMNTDDSEFE
jgi:hypothetical protein